MFFVAFACTFVNNCIKADIDVKAILADAHFQAARIERQLGTWKAIVIDEKQLVSPEEKSAATSSLICLASLSSRQWTFGCELRIPKASDNSAGSNGTHSAMSED